MIWGLRRKIGGRPPPPEMGGPPRNQILATPLPIVDVQSQEGTKRCLRPWALFVQWNALSIKFQVVEGGSNFFPDAISNLIHLPGNPNKMHLFSPSADPGSSAEHEGGNSAREGERMRRLDRPRPMLSRLPRTLSHQQQDSPRQALNDYPPPPLRPLLTPDIVKSPSASFQTSPASCSPR